MKLYHIIPCLLSLCNIGSSTPVVEKCSLPINAECTRELNLQVCGTLLCEYGNLCLAKHAGYDITACKPKEVVEKCSRLKKKKCNKKEKMLQLCGSSLKCKYKNPCLAKHNGYNSGSECESVEVVEKCSLPKKNNCRKKKKPQLCGSLSLQCKYKNLCLAKRAGYIASECEPGEVVKKCSLPKKNNCKKKKKPLVCGPLQCKYKNPCLAKRAGYKNVSSECKPVEVVEKCNLPIDDFCTDDWNPQVCGPFQCKYQNPCWALSAGYDVASDCEPIEDNTEECPANQPEPNSSGCTLSESINCKYGKETCCPNGGAKETFASVIATCNNNSWMITYTDACDNPNSDCPFNDEGCPPHHPKRSECALSEKIICKYGEETCCPNGGSEKTFPNYTVQCVNKKWILSDNKLCDNAGSKCKDNAE